MHTQAAVGRGAASLYAANIFNLLANTAYFVVLTNFLNSTVDVGIVTALNIMILFLVTISILAQPVTVQSPIPAPLAVLKFLPEYLIKGDLGIARRVFIFSLSVTGLMSGALAAIVLAFPDVTMALLGGEGVLPIYIRLAALDIITLALAQICLGTVVALGDMKTATVLILSWSIVRYTSASLFLARYAISGVLIGYVLGDGVLLVFALLRSIRVLRVFPQGSDFSLKELARYSGFTATGALIGFAVSQTDKIFALAKQGLPELAVYNVAIVASSFTGFAPYALLTVLLPALSALHASERAHQMREMVNTYSRYVAILVIPIAVGFASLTEVALRIFGLEYGSGFGPSVIVSIATGITAVGSVYAALLLALGELKWYTAANLAGLLALIIVSFLTTPILGLIGPALGRACLLIISSLLYAFASRKKGFFGLDLRAFLGAAGASTLMGFVVFELISWPQSFYVKFALVAPLIGLGAAIYLGCLRMLRLLRPDDFEFVSDLLPKELRGLVVKLGRLAAAKE